MKRRSIMIAGISVVLIVATAWVLRSAEETESREIRTTQSPSRSASASPDNTRESTRREGRFSSHASRIDSRLTRHDAGKLVNFILPKVEGKDVTIQQAVAILKEAYLDACYLSREKPLDLEFSVKDDPGCALSFSLKGKSFITCLNHIAALAALEARRNEASIELYRSEAAGQPAELSIAKNAAAMSQLRELAGQAPAAMENDWEALLRASGYILEAGTTLTANEAGFLVIKGSKAEIDRVKSALLLATKFTNQIKLSTRLVETDSPIDIKDPNFTPSEAAELMRELASRAGTKLTTEPSVTTRDGESSTVEVIREKIDANQITDWTGLKHEMSATHTGLKIVGSDRSEKRPENAGESGWLSENDFALYPGEMHAQLVSSGDGTYRYRLLTVTPIDATGTPVIPGQTSANNNSFPSANPVPGKAGFVFSPHNNRIVDVNGLPSGTLVMDPAYPQSDKKFFRVP